MADIDIEQRDSVNWLWWVLGLLLVGLVAFLLADALGDDEEVAFEDEVVAPVATEPLPETAPPAIEQPMTPAAVQQFIATCAERQPSEMGLDHQYTSNCVRDLLAALGAAVPANQVEALGLTGEMEDAREAAQNLAASEQDVTRHSEMTRNAFISIAEVVDHIQDESFPALETNADQLDEAADAIAADTDLLEQRTEVQTFFARAGELLQGMSMAPANTTTM
jgi:hypothetical protein